MFCKKVFNLYLNTNLNRLSFSALNSFKYQNKFQIRNEYLSTDPVSKSNEEGTPIPRVLSNRYGFKYVSEYNNFRHPLRDIIDLKFTIDDKRESFKLINRLMDDLENESLWQETLDCFNKESNEFDLEDLLKASALTASLTLKPTTKKKLLNSLIKSLDSAIKRRTLPIDDILEILYVVKHTFLLRKKLQNFRFYGKFMNIYEKLGKYKPPQSLHLYYYFEKFKECKKGTRYIILKDLKENAMKLNCVELGIIFAALARNKIYLNDLMLIEGLSKKLSEEIESVDSEVLFYTSKFFLGSSTRNNFHFMENFQNSLIPHTSKFSTSSLIMSLLSSYPYHLNLELWDKVLEHVKADIKTLDIVDIKRMSQITIMFNVDDKNFLKLALETVEEMETDEKDFPHLLGFCKNLVINKIYPEKLLNIIFSEEFIKKMLKRNYFKEIGEWSFINNTLKIDKPELQCNNLNETTGRKIERNWHDFMPLGKFFLGSKIVKSILFHRLKNFYGENAIVKSFSPPHFEMAAIMIFDENLNALPIPEEFKNLPRRGFVKPTNDNFWICINSIYNVPEGLNPLQETYKRHISASGCVPVLVPESIFFKNNLPVTEMNKDIFQNIIEKAVEESLQKKQIKINS